MPVPENCAPALGETRSWAKAATPMAATPNVLADLMGAAVQHTEQHDPLQEVAKREVIKV